MSDRPRTRGECVGGARPCPWVGCRHHLYLEVHPSTGRIKLTFNLEPWELAESCSLDVADRGMNTLEIVGQLLNITRERSRQIEAKACAAGLELAVAAGIEAKDAYFPHPAGFQHPDEPPKGNREESANRARAAYKERQRVAAANKPNNEEIMNYTATYKAETIAGEPGWSWHLFSFGRLVAEGWTRGKKSEAETEVRTAIAARDTLLSFVA